MKRPQVCDCGSDNVIILYYYHIIIIIIVVYNVHARGMSPKIVTIILIIIISLSEVLFCRSGHPNIIYRRVQPWALSTLWTIRRCINNVRCVQWWETRSLVRWTEGENNPRVSTYDSEIGNGQCGCGGRSPRIIRSASGGLRRDLHARYVCTAKRKT